MDVTRNPKTMTATERHHEIIGILAQGLLRSVRHVRLCQSHEIEKVSESDKNGLDLCANLPLNVAPRPTPGKTG